MNNKILNFGVHWIFVAILGLIALDIAFRFPYPVFIAAFAFLAALSFAIGRLFESHEPHRFDSADSRRLRFQVHSSTLCMSGDFNFNQVKTVAATNGSIVATLDIPSGLDRIVGITLEHEAVDGFAKTAPFVVPVDFGLLFITDGIIRDRPDLQREIRDLACGKLKSPIAEILYDGSRPFGIMLQPSYGNGEYAFRTTTKSIASAFE